MGLGHLLSINSQGNQKHMFFPLSDNRDSDIKNTIIRINVATHHQLLK